jgi:hypothetical protein
VRGTASCDGPAIVAARTVDAQRQTEVEGFAEGPDWQSYKAEARQELQERLLVLGQRFARRRLVAKRIVQSV